MKQDALDEMSVDEIGGLIVDLIRQTATPEQMPTIPIAIVARFVDRSGMALSRIDAKFGWRHRVAAKRRARLRGKRNFWRAVQALAFAADPSQPGIYAKVYAI